MHITIGILAHNESALIGRMITSLFSQSVFTEAAPTLRGVQWEVVVVPNGCSDDTHERAVEALQAACAACAHAQVGFRVESLQRAGKSHAWNELVHRIAAPDTDFFVMIDADIDFGHTETIANCVARLQTDSHAWAVTDQALKDFHRKANSTWLERMSLRASRDRDAESPIAIAGSFYVIAAPRMRTVWMPVGLPGEDGFLCIMIMTDCFRRPVDYSRIVRADNASHYYEGLTRPGAIIQHEVRAFIGTAINAFVCWDMLLFMTPPHGPGAGVLIRELNEQTPDWFRGFIDNQIGIRGWWAFRTSALWEHFTEWARLPWPLRLWRLPRTLAFSAFHLVVIWRANRLLVSRKAVDYW
jgi:glycosyltransferase involved in cell wall biosynthesis